MTSKLSQEIQTKTFKEIREKQLKKTHNKNAKFETWLARRGDKNEYYFWMIIYGNENI